MKKDTNKIITFRRIMLFTDLIILLMSGVLYGWSVFVTPLEVEFGWSRSQTSLTYTISSISNTLAGVIAACLSHRLSRRKIVTLASFLAICGMILASFTSTLWQLYIGYGILFGASTGMVYNAVISSVILWFPDIPTTISGFLLMSYGLSAAIFSPLANLGIEIFGWRTTFRIVGVIALIIYMFCGYFVRCPYVEETKLLPKSKKVSTASCEVGMTPKQMVHQKNFWVYAVWTIAMASVGMALSSHASPIAQSLHYSAAVAALFAGLVSVCNGIGRLIFGVIYDQIGQKTLLVVPIVCIIGSSVLIIAYNTSLSWLLIPAFILLGLSFGASPVCSTGFIKSNYGSAYYGLNLGLANLAVLLSAYIGPYISGVLFENSGYGAVFMMMLYLAPCAGIMAIIILFSDKRLK